MQSVRVGDGSAVQFGTFNNDARKLTDAINSAGVLGLSATANRNIQIGTQSGVSAVGVVYGFTINGESFTIEGSGSVAVDMFNIVEKLNWASGSSFVGAAEVPGGLRLEEINDFNPSNDGRNIILTETIPGSAAFFGLGGLVGSEGRGSSINLTYEAPPWISGNVVFTNTGMADESFVPVMTGTRISEIDLALVAGANEAIVSVDRALAKINFARARLGAAMNRFEQSIGAQRISIEAQTASRSRIEDADFAKETAAMTRAQILQQSGMAILAQANALPQNVLALLG